MTNRLKAAKFVMPALAPLTKKGLIEPDDAEEAIRSYMNGDERFLASLLEQAIESAGSDKNLVEAAQKALSQG